MCFQGEIVPKVDPKTFKLLVSGAPYQVYGIDNNAVFYTEKLLKNADAKTFEIIKNKTEEEKYDAQDKNYFYIRDTAVKKL